MTATPVVHEAVGPDDSENEVSERQGSLRVASCLPGSSLAVNSLTVYSRTAVVLLWAPASEVAQRGCQSSHRCAGLLQKEKNQQKHPTVFFSRMLVADRSHLNSSAASAVSFIIALKFGAFPVPAVAVWCVQNPPFLWLQLLTPGGIRSSLGLCAVGCWI